MIRVSLASFLLFVACSHPVDSSRRTCTTDVCDDVCSKGSAMRSVPTNLLACAFAISCSCHPMPSPGGAGGQSSGGWTSSGGSSAASSTATAGSSAYGGGTWTTQPAVAGTSSVVAFPSCNTEGTRGLVVPARHLTGWHPDPLRKHRRRAVQSAAIPNVPSVFWTPNVDAALDQGTLGSCTGNAVAQCLSTQPWSARLTESDAVRIYSRATAIDPFRGTYPPTDTGSNGASAWQAAIDLGYVSVPVTAVDSLPELASALQTSPCVLGTDWYEGFFSPTACGELRPTGAVRGGHEPLVVGFDRPLGRWWLRNSWGAWGVSRGSETGYAYLTTSTFQSLLDRGAEIDCPAHAP